MTTIREFFKRFINFFKCKKKDKKGVPVTPIPEPTLELIPVELIPIEPIPELIVKPVVVEPVIVKPVVVEPVIEPVIEPVVEPVIEPVIEPFPEPIIVPIIVPIVKPIVKPVPILEKSEIIEMLFIEYKNKYPSFYKSKPRRPNFNEFSFYGLCNKIEFTSKSDLSIILKKLNQERKISNLLHLSETQKVKCEEMDFYLFTN